MGLYDAKMWVERTKKGGVHSERVTKFGIWSNANPRGRHINNIVRDHRKLEARN